MASPAWLPQEAKPPVSGETSLPMASPAPSSAHATPSTGKPTPTFVLSIYRMLFLLSQFAKRLIYNATAFVAPAPATPFPHGVLQNANVSGSPQQSSTHNVSIVRSYLLLVLSLLLNGFVVMHVVF